MRLFPLIDFTRSLLVRCRQQLGELFQQIIRALLTNQKMLQQKVGLRLFWIRIGRGGRRYVNVGKIRALLRVVRH